MNEVRIEESLPENPAVSVPRPRWFHYWPLGLFLLVLFSFDCLLPSAMNILPREISKGYLGVFVGHLLIASIVASLLFPSWILGTLVGSLFVSIAFGAVLWGSGSYSLLVQGGEGEVWRLIWGILPAPFVVLACSLPLLIVRSLLGWRIQRTEARVHRGQSIRLEDIFLTMIVLAAVLSLSIAPSIAMEIERRDYLLGIAVIGASSCLSASWGESPSFGFGTGSKTRCHALGFHSFGCCWSVSSRRCSIHFIWSYNARRSP